MDAAWIPPAPGPHPQRAGNAVTPLVGEFAFFDALEAAFDGARRRIWMTLSFVNRAFVLPSGRALWAQLRAAADRGVEVRLLAWQNPGFFAPRNLFAGPNLPALDPRWQVRWDPSPTPAHCHHEKIWIVDAGEPTEHAFVAGVVLTRTDLAVRRAAGRAEGRFDMGLSAIGPVARDVARVFQARWRRLGPDPVRLAPPEEVAAVAGGAPAQLGRTERPGLLWPAGLTTIHAQYQRAFDAARDRIVLVNQHPGELDLLQRLDRALARGVSVQLIVPGEPMAAIGQARRSGDPRYRATFEALSALGAHPGFSLAAPRLEGAWTYVHAKLCVVDGAFVSCGSANLVDLSLAADHTETNLHVWSAPLAGAIEAALDRQLALHALDPQTYAL